MARTHSGTGKGPSQNGFWGQTIPALTVPQNGVLRLCSEEIEPGGAGLSVDIPDYPGMCTEYSVMIRQGIELGSEHPIWLQSAAANKNAIYTSVNTLPLAGIPYRAQPC